MITVRINKSWFYSAGKQYGWVKDGFDVRGVGIEAKLLGATEEIEVIIDDEVYTARTLPLKEFVARYKSVYNANRTKVAIVSKTCLTRQYTASPVSSGKIEEVNPQQDLFSTSEKIQYEA